jgi:hypothetical protein
MAKKKKTAPPMEILVKIGGLALVATPDKRSAEFDRLLEQQGAESFVFIPLAKLGKRKQRNARKLAQRKTKLPPGTWHDGELQSTDGGDAVPGVLAFDIRRRNAREIAESLDVKQFFWGASGVPVEQHAVQIFKNSDSRAWKAIRRRSFGGLFDMVASARNIGELPTAVLESQTTMQKFWQLVAIVLSVAVAAGIVHATIFWLLGSEDSESWMLTTTKILFYPVVIPAIFVGVYLRVLVRKGEEDGRDFTAAEAEENWHKVAPHLLALWGLCWLAVLILTWMQSVPSADLPFLGRTDGVMTSFIVCVWMLLPIANSHNVETLFGSAFESAITAAVSIFTIKVSLYITNQLTDALWGVLIGLVPFDIPERLQQVINSFIHLGAEVFFVAVLLGYAWSRTRQQFMRL